MSVANVQEELRLAGVSGVVVQDFGAGGIETDLVAESTAATGVTIDGVILKDTTVDVGGTADAVILDADGDTTISAPTDDQIDIEVGGADVAVIYANGVQDHGNEAVTATVGGGTTGLITQGARFVTITAGGDANSQVSLPAATVGDEITLYIGATGCEIISAVAGDKINNVVVGATNELAMPATSFVQLRYWAADNWSAWGHTTAGVINATMTPDALV